MEIPPHVPADRVVHDFPLYLGAVTTDDPFDAMIPALHARYPEIFYATNVYPGGTPGWVLRRAADLKKVYADTVHFSSKDFAPFAKLIGDNWSQVPAETDPPLHGLYRTLVNPLFSPQAIGKLETYVRDRARRFIDGFRDRGECDFVAEFSVPFPVAVFLHLMGLPEEEMPQFLEWEHGLIHTPEMSAVAAATRGVIDYLRNVIADRRKKPREDLITFGVQATIEGRRLTDDELIGFCFGLYVGGLDTVTTNIGLQFRHLATHLDDQRTLRADPRRLPQAIEEMMRCYPAVTTFRTCIADYEIGGISFRPGDKVAMSTTLAGRDPLEYDRPDEVMLDRRATHLSFAYGPHRCLGAQLARRELLVSMEEMFAAVPEFRLKPGALIVTTLGGIIQPTTLPLIWAQG
jgi:cytochrome P450